MCVFASKFVVVVCVDLLRWTFAKRANKNTRDELVERKKVEASRINSQDKQEEEESASWLASWK